MQYQLQVDFADERSPVIFQAKDERSAFETFAAMSALAGVKAVSMAGIWSQYLGPAMAMRPPPPPSPPSPSPPQTQTVPSGPTALPPWIDSLKRTAAQIGSPTPSPRVDPPQVDAHVEQYEEDEVVAPKPSPAPRGKTPLEEYSGQQVFTPGEPKRFKRAVDFVRPRSGGQSANPNATPSAVQSVVQTAVQSAVQSVASLPNDAASSLNALFGLDSTGQQGLLRPFSKQDAGVLLQADTLLTESLETDKPKNGHSPIEVASFIMQKCIPLFGHVDWSQHGSFRNDFNRILVTCQRILTGQATQSETSQ